jgi:hypothetical protein
LELDPPGALVQLFDGELTIHHSEHDHLVPWLDDSVYDQYVVVEDAGILHGVTGNTLEKGRLRMCDRTLDRPMRSAPKSSGVLGRPAQMRVGTRSKRQGEAVMGNGG